MYWRYSSPRNESQLFEGPKIVDEEGVHQDKEGDRLKGLQNAAQLFQRHSSCEYRYKREKNDLIGKYQG
jgi:hypothetical protein